MGFLSGWFSSPESAPGNTTTSGPPAASQQHSATQKVWRSVFDPGSNPNIDRVGSSYYDTVKDGKSSGTTWDMILKAQDYSRKSFSDLDRDKNGFVDAKELKAAMPPSLKDKVDTDSLIKQAKPSQEGRLTRKEFNEVLDKYFLA
eukprot:GHRR01000497.1.p1 GENE.GHRR01000497.1~~GHRR01000497.1.p1  ORF type:complete len:145 (+),score=28.68 GHRR01000497.1:203-637(+)